MARTLRLAESAGKRELLDIAGAAWDIVMKPLARWRGDRMWWPPLNDQAIRVATVTHLIEAYRPDAVVETGTFRGASTGFFTRFGTPVVSVEISVRHHTVALARLWRRRRVTLVVGESTALLERLALSRSLLRPFFYLDAHWGDPLPLRRELEIIWSSWEDAVVAIDDFRVPHDPAYGYDVYGHQPIELDYCAPPSDVAVCFPALPAAAETGHRRGTAYMGKGKEGAKAIQSGIEAGLLLGADRRPAARDSVDPLGSQG